MGNIVFGMSSRTNFAKHAIAKRFAHSGVCLFDTRALRLSTMCDSNTIFCSTSMAKFVRDAHVCSENYFATSS